MCFVSPSKYYGVSTCWGWTLGVGHEAWLRGCDRQWLFGGRHKLGWTWELTSGGLCPVGHSQAMEARDPGWLSFPKGAALAMPLTEIIFPPSVF